MTDDVFEDGDDALTFDMEAVEESVNEIVPKGKYQAVIEECEYKLSASSSKPMWSIAMVITEGDYKGRKLFTNMSFSEKALPITKGQLLAFAPDVISNAFDPRKLAAEGAIVGKKVTATTKIEKYEGQDRTRVSALAAPLDAADGFLDG